MITAAEPIDYRRYAILYVDDEEKSLKYFKRAFEDSFKILTAPNASEGLDLLASRREDIGILMSDQRMPGETGVSLLEKARKLDPRILRILITAHSDLETAVKSVNSGAVFQYLTKPWQPDQLESTLKRSLEYFTVQQQRDRLLKEKLNVVQNMLRGDRAESLSILAAGMNHHMRNALTSIKTFVDMVPYKLEQELPPIHDFVDEEFWGSYHNQVGEQVARMISILERVWESSCEKELHFQKGVNVQEVINETVSIMRVEFEQSALQLHLDMKDDLPDMTTNRMKLCQLIRLLLQDELANLQPGHQVFFGVEPVASFGGEDRPGIHLWIADDGEIVEEALLDHLFDPFFFRGQNLQELGTNLMACYHIVHLHGGHIAARNDFNGHTTIHIYLPLEPAAAAPQISEQDLAAKIAATEASWERMQRA